MASSRPYIGCKIRLISKAQNRYEGILYTVDARSSTLVLAKVICFGTEGRPTGRPTPPRDIIYEFITFRGSDILDISLCEPPQHELSQDPAIIQSSTAGSSAIGSGLQSLGLMGTSAYNQLAASSLLNQQYAAALGLVPESHVRRGPMVEKAVQTLQMERRQQRRCFTGLQEEQLDTRKPRRNRRSTMKLGSGVTTSQQGAWQQNQENRPPARRRPGPRRRRNRSRGQLAAGKVPVPILKFDTDFDFDLANAQFIKEEVERKLHSGIIIKGGNYEEQHEKEGLQLDAQDEHSGAKWYYDKAKSFFDNISSDGGLRLTWAEERKRNLETFGFPGRYLRSQGFRGGYTRGRGRGAALPPQRIGPG